MAKWGISVTADEVMAIQTPHDFETLVAQALERRAKADM
jgi:hypothetical protein